MTHHTPGLVLHPLGCLKLLLPQGLGRTLYERLQELYGNTISEMLTVQYRMNAKVMQWSSQELYGGRIAADASVADHTLCGLKVRLMIGPV